MRGMVLLLLASSIALGLGCAGNDSTSEDASSGETPSSFVVRGRYEGRAMSGQAMRVAHESIPGYMAAMTMDFPVRDTSEVTGLMPGDKIEFTLTLTEMEGYAHGVHKLDPSTKLEIDE